MNYGLPKPAPEFTTIKVRMNKTTNAIPFPGSPEVTYEEGQEYDLPEWLAEAFFRGGEADPAEAYQQPGYAAIFEQAESAPDPAPEPKGRTKRRAPAAKS